MPSERSKGVDITQQILAHATRLFAARGFVGASLRDIAKAVGIRKPSLLYHFNSKDELRRGVLEKMLAHWNEVVPRLLKAATSGHEQFQAVATETLEFFRSYAESFGKPLGLEGRSLDRLPNLLLVGYLLRVLEERLLDEPSEGPLES